MGSVAAEVAGERARTIETPPFAGVINGAPHLTLHLVNRSEGLDQTAVNDEIGAGDVPGAIACEQKHQVRDFVRPGKTTGGKAALALDDLLPGSADVDSRGLRDSRGNTLRS